MTKVKVKALQSFAHGNIEAHQGETVTMNKGDADELMKAGFVQGEADVEVPTTQVQVEQPPQEHQQGDVVTDDPETGEPDGKAAQDLDNKMAAAPENKASRKTTKAK